MKTSTLLLLLLPLLYSLLGISDGRTITGTITFQWDGRKLSQLPPTSPAAPLPFTPRRMVVKSLVLSNGLDWGEWAAEPDYCQDGSYAVSAEAKFESYNILDNDETALTGVKLYCVDSYGQPTGYVTSTTSSKGEWQGMRNCLQGYITAMMGRVLEPQGIIGDDVAVQNIKLECDFGVTMLTLVENAQVRTLPELHTEEDLRELVTLRRRSTRIPLGDWGLWSTCPKGSAVCGVETKLEDPNLITDDTGITDVSMFCCTVEDAYQDQKKEEKEEKKEKKKEKKEEEESDDESDDDEV